MQLQAFKIASTSINFDQQLPSSSLKHVTPPPHSLLVCQQNNLTYMLHSHSTPNCVSPKWWPHVQECSGLSLTANPMFCPNRGFFSAQIGWNLNCPPSNLGPMTNLVTQGPTPQ